MKTIRTFIAIDISPELKNMIKEKLQEFRRFPVNVRWVSVESIHLTLKFLGEITPEQVQEVFKVVEAVAPQYTTFALQTTTTGAFPSLAKPRVLWLGLNSSGVEQLKLLQRDLEKALEGVGFPREQRPFKPHLTLGRVRDPRGMESFMKKFINSTFPEIQFSVREILVMKSELTREGAKYSVQKAVPLLTI